MIEHCGLVFLVARTHGQAEERLVYLGDDDGGTALEVMAVELETGGIHVIHAMALRTKYRGAYEEARRWRV